MCAIMLSVCLRPLGLDPFYYFSYAASAYVIMGLEPACLVGAVAVEPLSFEWLLLT